MSRTNKVVWANSFLTGNSIYPIVTNKHSGTVVLSNAIRVKSLTDEDQRYTKEINTVIPPSITSYSDTKDYLKKHLDGFRSLVQNVVVAHKGKCDIETKHMNGNSKVGRTQTGSYCMQRLHPWFSLVSVMRHYALTEESIISGIIGLHRFTDPKVVIYEHDKELVASNARFIMDLCKYRYFDYHHYNTYLGQIRLLTEIGKAQSIVDSFAPAEPV